MIHNKLCNNFVNKKGVDVPIFNTLIYTSAWNVNDVKFHHGVSLINHRAKKECTYHAPYNLRYVKMKVAKYL
jgi:hypothetical protein